MDAPYDFVTFPEIAPPPLRGTVWVLGQKYTLPEGKSSKMKMMKSCCWQIAMGVSLYPPQIKLS